MATHLLHLKKFWLLCAILMGLAALLAACGGKAAVEVPKPSNPGPAGEAVRIPGNPALGEQLFTNNCAACHGDQGKQGVPNPGSKRGTVPNLNPIDPAMLSDDRTTFATHIDLFVEHGSTPEGSSPALKMLAFGDDKTFTTEQIADVIAYVMSLNTKK